MGEILFSIPIYALNEQELDKQYETSLNKFLSKAKDNLEAENEKIMRFQTIHKNQMVHKNYIVGFIDIVKHKGEIRFVKYITSTTKYVYTKKEREEFLDSLINNKPNKEDASYIWAKKNSTTEIPYIMRYGTEKKHYMCEIMVPGLRIFDFQNKDNNDILEEIEEDLEWVLQEVKDFYKGKVYIDMNNFNSIKKHLNFHTLLNHK